MEKLEKFIVKAKANGWVSAQPGGKKIAPSRLGSLDIIFEEDEFFYQDSFVGLSDFCGQEHVCKKGEPVWSMAYYGAIIHPALIDASQDIQVLRAALGSLYSQNRFLGEFRFNHDKYQYHDTNEGNVKNFHGIEKILLENIVVYNLRYFGGLIQK